MKDLAAPSQKLTPRVPEPVSFDGAELLWIDAILLVPAIFGIMFLPDVLRAIVLSVVVGLIATYFLLYALARTYWRCCTSDLARRGPDTRYLFPADSGAKVGRHKESAFMRIAAGAFL